MEGSVPESFVFRRFATGYVVSNDAMLRSVGDLKVEGDFAILGYTGDSVVVSAREEGVGTDWACDALPFAYACCSAMDSYLSDSSSGSSVA